METIDLFLSISQEPNSHAAYFLLKWGVNRRGLVEFYSQTHGHLNKKPKDVKNSFDKILDEYCTDLNQ
jgi:hypothetical protein